MISDSSVVPEIQARLGLFDICERREEFQTCVSDSGHESNASRRELRRTLIKLFHKSLDVKELDV